MCKGTLYEIRVKKENVKTGKISYDFLIYCNKCDKIPKHGL